MNIPYRNLVCALAVLGLATAAPMALAQTHKSRSAEKQSGQDAAAIPATTGDTAAPADVRPHTWQEIDADGDGVITREEARADAGLSKVFDEADADADGRLTTAEYTAYIQKRNDAAATQQDGAGKPS